MGKHKYIETPDKMWGLFLGYKSHIKSNPILVEDYVGKDAMRVYREKEQPLIMEGFECYVMDNTNITYPDLSQYFSNRNEAYSNYSAICSRIKQEIRADQLRLGLANLINPSITQRLNGLTDRAEIDHTTKGEKIEEKKTISITLPNGKQLDDFKID